MTNLTVYDLMAEDHVLWVKYIKPDIVQVVINNESDYEVYSETGHINAWEAMVSFAKQVLACDERLRQELEIIE